MPIRPPVLDDRSFDQLVEETLARIPAHTPEWTNPRPGDPGRTLVELFAWLVDTMLYRVNRIPDRQRLTFLRLLGLPLRPARSARGIVTLALADDRATAAVSLRTPAALRGPLPFETRGEITVLPAEARCFVKRDLEPEVDEADAELEAMRTALQELYLLDEPPRLYATTPVFAGGAPEPRGLDVVGTADGALWLALMAARPEAVAAVRDALGGAGGAPQRVLNVGVVPAVEVPAMDEEIRERAGIPHVWELSTGATSADEPAYTVLDVVHDATRGLLHSGVVRLALPEPARIGAPPNDVRQDLQAGVGDRPPRLDDPEQAARLVGWLRLRPTVALHTLRLDWVGINAVEADQRETVTARIVGQSDGNPDQQMQLPVASVEAESLELEVEEPGRAYQPWRRIDDLATAGRDDRVFELDAESGTVRFGDGVRGRIPEPGQRVRVARMRAGGGSAGNLPAGSITAVTAFDLAGRAAPRLRVHQPLPTKGGADAETLEEAERRIPAALRHRNRAVTADDYRRLAAETPGVHLGRVEVLPRFRPHQRRSDVPGVVSVMVLPHQAAHQPPNPRPDRPLREAVHDYLDARRPIATEMYVIGCEYVPVGVGAAITVRDGFGRDATVHAVREEVRRYLWPLAPGGPDEGGWPLGRTVRDREIEVVVARVAGVATVAGVNLFERREGIWRLRERGHPDAAVEVPLLRWQLPELLSLVVVADEPQAPLDLSGPAAPGGSAGGGGAAGGGRPSVAVPVVPEVC